MNHQNIRGRPGEFCNNLRNAGCEGIWGYGTDRLRLIRDRFIAGHNSCDLRRHLDSAPPETPIRDVVDRCRVWESHADPASSRMRKPTTDCPPADVPPGVVQKAASNMTLSNRKIDDNPEKCEQEVWINRKLYSPWVCAIHQYGRQNSDMRQTDSRDVAECSITSDCLQPEKGNCLPHAVCDDSVALKPLIQIIRALFSDDGDTTGRSGHDTDDGGSPAGLLGYLLWCLYWPRGLHGMTQYLAKIKGPSVNILTRVIMNDGGLWDVRISVTLPATYTGMEIHPTVIGLRASVGGSAASSD